MAESEAVERTDEVKAQAFAAMTGSISVIDNVLDDNDDVQNVSSNFDISDDIIAKLT